jgi:hypothetical protein
MLRTKNILTLSLVVVMFLSFLLTACSQESSPSPAVSSVSESNSIETSNNLVQPISNGIESSSSTTERKTISPDEIMVNSLTTAEKLSTLKFDMGFKMNFDFEERGQSQNMSMQEIATGEINIPGKEMVLLADLNMNIPNQSLQNMSADMYLTGGWIYMKANIPGAGISWKKMKLTDELWRQQSRMTSMTEFLKSPINVEQLGSENIRGLDCYVLSITPDMKAVSEWMAGQTFAGQSGMDPARLNMSPSMGDFKIKAWISKNDYLLAQQQIGIKFNLSSGNTAAATPDTPGQITMDMDALLNYYDYQKPVVIQLPSEALNAREMPSGTPSSSSTSTTQN